MVFGLWVKVCGVVCLFLGLRLGLMALCGFWRRICLLDFFTG